MKKLVVVLLALAVFGVLAFADDAAAAPVVSIGDWGRQVFVFGSQDNNGGTYAGLGASWGGNPRIVGLNIQAHTDTAGFSITPQADSGSFGLTDQNKAWINPIPGLTFESGINLETDTWRGSSDFGSDDWLRMSGVAVGGNSSTFARLGEGGFMTDLNYNKNGIGAWVALQSGNATVVTDIPNAIQAGAAYAVPGLLTIKAQYLGKTVGGTGMMGNPGGAQVINAAVNVSAVKGLYEEVGIMYPLTDVGYTFAFSDETSFAMAPLTIHARAQGVSYNGNAGTTSGFALAGAAGVDYDLGNGIGVTADFQYVSAQQENAGNANGALGALTGFGAYIKKGFSNGYIGIGFEYSSLGWNGVYNAYSATSAAAGPHWAVPIVASEWF